MKNVIMDEEDLVEQETQSFRRQMLFWREQARKYAEACHQQEVLQKDFMVFLDGERKR